MLVLQKGLILPVPIYGGSYFFIQPRICEALILWTSQGILTYFRTRFSWFYTIFTPFHLILVWHSFSLPGIKSRLLLVHILWVNNQSSWGIYDFCWMRNSFPWNFPPKIRRFQDKIQGYNQKHRLRQAEPLLHKEICSWSAQNCGNHALSVLNLWLFCLMIQWDHLINGCHIFFRFRFFLPW